MLLEVVHDGIRDIEPNTMKRAREWVIHYL